MHPHQPHATSQPLRFPHTHNFQRSLTAQLAQLAQPRPWLVINGTSMRESVDLLICCGVRGAACTVCACAASLAPPLPPLRCLTSSHLPELCSAWSWLFQTRPGRVLAPFL